MTEAWAWPLGICLALFGSSVLALGLLIQKFAHLRNLRLPPNKQKPYVCQPIWIGGFVLFVGSNFFDMAALALISQSLVAPLGSASLVVNALVSPCFLKEKLYWSDILATVLIIMGISAVIVLRDAKEFDETASELIDRFSQPGVIAFLCFVFAMISTLGAGIVIAECRLKAYTGTERKLSRYNAFRAMRCGRVASWFLVAAYPSIGAAMASITILFAKATGQVLINLMGGKDYDNPWAYLIPLVTVTSAFMQITLINASLKVLDALFHIPFFFVVWNILSITGGGLYWGDFDGMKDYQIGGSVAGFVFICLGVCLLSLRAFRAPSGGSDPWKIEDKTEMYPGDMEARREHVLDQLRAMPGMDDQLREVVSELELSSDQLGNGSVGGSSPPALAAPSTFAPGMPGTDSGQTVRGKKQPQRKVVPLGSPA